ncbi:MAG: hypothetical protein ACYSTY_06180 [Planctomycetota bacterium]|jgi:hypothetical protein
MKKALFGLSLALNVLLVAALLWIRAEGRETAHGALADATAAEVRLQQYVLAELESGDPQRVEAVKSFLRRNIDAGDVLAADWRNAID